ncbi:MAG: endonuclease III [Euryarchaeota archaeon]|nr:endonuclease III [Euryarchaeota archaeon]
MDPAPELLRRLRRAYPGAGCAFRLRRKSGGSYGPTATLHFQGPYQCLVAVMLSAQTTDAKVNTITPELFQRYPDPEALAGAPVRDLERILRPLGLHRTKARSLRGAGRVLHGRFRGRVPRTLEGLMEIPGVGRKSANAILGNAWGLAEGVVVDTHVARLSRRLGLARGETPEKIEGELMEEFPRDDWIDLGHLLIHHGRQVCHARGPRCGECPLDDLCPKVGVREPKG